MAAKKKTGGPSAATIKYVMANQLSSVGLGADVVDSDGVLRFSRRGVAYATFPLYVFPIEGGRAT